MSSERPRFADVVREQLRESRARMSPSLSPRQREQRAERDEQREREPDERETESER